MLRYRFTREIIAEGRAMVAGVAVLENKLFRVGQEVNDTDLPAGTVASLLGVKAIEKIETPAKK